MADRADVRSLQQLEFFLQQTEAMRGSLLKELEGLALELRRLTNWLSQEVIDYWREELTKAQRRWTECRENLSRCLSAVRSDEQRPCTDEKKRLRIAEQRLELCQEKLRVSQAALVYWEAERNKQRSYIVRCRDLAESDLRVACEHLRGQIGRLAAYTELRSGAFTNNSSGDSPTSSTGILPADTSPAADKAPPAEHIPGRTPDSENAL